MEGYTNSAEGGTAFLFRLQISDLRLPAIDL